MVKTVLSIDPGITTGFCFAAIDVGTIKMHPFQLKESLLDNYKLIDLLKPQHVVIEDFLYRKGQRDKVILYSVQVIGVANLWCEANDRVATMQTPATGKGFYTDTQLKRLKAHKSGIPHAMDATRHLFHWMTFGPGFQFVDPDNAKIEFFDAMA